ncbi:hypothetical protein CYLTODRAFT_459152 [Cylindrobasidium torrendii FP15055 ss-10]|uniref:Endonuclease/exonuclease/phosphatase domain-containing protein n=1 Tax=Cylindrobasidium torrendii FP15055 ss-10 TaxID=1314674 RepID=A0A0D7AYA6_9AGAR|nr:hypothetical protein CYLTODRAFT_459152 [Cylindrobasidium torrendii FP15055 ss-10]
MFLDSPRISRALSVFDHARCCWAAIPLRSPQEPVTPSSFPSRPSSARAVGKQKLSLTSWNIQASPFKTVARSELILNHILKGPELPDIVFLQEVTMSVRQSILDNPIVQSAFLTITDAKDKTTFSGVPFATMALLSNKRFFYSPLAAEDDTGAGGSKMMLDSVFRMELPSRYGRDALCVNIRKPAAPDTVLRLFNVHLESLDSQLRRSFQMSVLAHLLREPGCSGGVIAGDFNPVQPSDLKLVKEHGLVDAWVALRGDTAEPGEGDTWGVEFAQRLQEFSGGNIVNEIVGVVASSIGESTPRMILTLVDFLDWNQQRFPHPKSAFGMPGGP